jgi:hypothetical protein
LLFRSLINVLPITSQEGVEHEQWYNLGKVRGRAQRLWGSVGVFHL